MVPRNVLEWLLEENEPSVRYETLIQLLGKDEKEGAVTQTQDQIGQTGWAAVILSKQREGVYWDNQEICYVLKY